MKNYKIQSALIIFSLAALFACNSSNKQEETTGDASNPMSEAEKPGAGKDNKGIGKFTEVPLTHPLDQSMITAGQAIYNSKCVSCHKITGEKLVGPGWKGVTDRRKPEWIMNFVTNTSEMLQKDLTAKSLYEICLVQMPNQALKDDEARDMLEFMRNNDGQK